MTKSWLRRVGAVALVVVCFTLLSTHVVAGSAALSQPHLSKTVSLASAALRAEGQSSPAGGPAPAPPIKPPAPAPPIKPPAPDPPVEPPAPVLPIEPPAPAPPVKDEAPKNVPSAPSPAAEVAELLATATDAVKVELLVKFAPGSNSELLAQARADLSARVTGRIPQLGVEIVQVESGTPALALEAIRRLPGVAYVEPNYPVHVLAVPDDPDVPLQWHLEAISAPAAWDVTTGSGVVIAVIDTGVDPSELDLKDKLVPGYDFVNDDPAPWDDQGHGTRIALIAAAARNGYGGAGVAYDARVMPLKALSNTGSGTHAWIAKAIVWAADNGADIINLSIGGPYSSETLREAVNYAWRRGILLVAAAGNEDSSVPVYPAAYDEVLAVVGTTREQQRASFSNWGDYVAVAAPGANILVSYGGGHQTGSGTSLATPQVSGVAALVLSGNPGLSGSQVRDIIQSTVNDLGNPGWDPFYGFGQVNAFQAVRLARAGSAGGPDPTHAVVDAVNRARQLRDLPTLLADSDLMAAAQRRADGLTSRCVSAGGISLAACVAQRNGVRRPAEVALVGISSPQAVVDLLAASPAGQELLFGAYWQIGVGYVDAGHGTLNQVWVLRFARQQPRPSLGPTDPIAGVESETQ